MKTVLEALPHLEKTGGDVGIEIEVEGRRLPNPENASALFRDLWRITQDGSLRGEEAWEYVFRRPYNMEGCAKALELLSKEYANHNSIVDDSVRAGIHVHVNVQDLTLNQLFIMLLIYYILEEPLVDFCGEGRQGNHFCLRAQDAEYIIFALYNAFSQGGMAGELASDNIRYSALNTSSLFKYGSIEFRTLRSTNDMKRIMNWATTLVRIRNASFGFETPKEVVESMSLDGAIPFARRVLGDLLDLYISPSFEDKIYEGVRRIQDVAFLVDMNKVKGLFQQKIPLIRNRNDEGFRNYNQDFADRGQVELPLAEEEKLVPNRDMFLQPKPKPMAKDNWKIEDAAMDLGNIIFDNPVAINPVVQGGFFDAAFERPVVNRDAQGRFVKKAIPIIPDLIIDEVGEDEDWEAPEEEEEE